jgi:hypothetical protein
MTDERRCYHDLSHENANKGQNQSIGSKSSIASGKKTVQPKLLSQNQASGKKMGESRRQPTDKGKLKGNPAQRSQLSSSPSSSGGGEPSGRQSLSETSSSEQRKGKGKERSQDSMG